VTAALVELDETVEYLENDSAHSGRAMNAGRGPRQRRGADLGATDALAVTSRDYGYCALFRSGGVKCWGPADYSLGLGDDNPRGDDPPEMGDALPYVDLDGMHAVVSSTPATT
jgi:hypothetical protein